jgi:hypothetical protein
MYYGKFNDQNNSGENWKKFELKHNNKICIIEECTYGIEENGDLNGPETWMQCLLYDFVFNFFNNLKSFYA